MTDYYRVDPDDDDELDGCDVDMTQPDQLTADDDVEALEMFADVDFTDEAAVEARRRELEALDPDRHLGGPDGS